MGRESINDPIVMQSSIALLQERFRQLQRMKEMREERELLRKLAEPKPCNPITTSLMGYDPCPSRLFFHHFLPPTSSSPPSINSHNFSSISWSASQSCKCLSSADFQTMEATPLFASLLPTITEKPNNSLNKFELGSDCEDVDTSLHL